MDKRVLMVATTPSMIGQFNMHNIRLLQSMSYQVDVACNFNDRTVWTCDKTRKFLFTLKQTSVTYWQIDFSRNIKNVKDHIIAYKQLKDLISNNSYSFIHCHSPIASVLSRIICHKLNIPVIYTAHGFHFYEGAPLRNWILYYPVEYWLSKWTNVLITINKEDFKCANHLKAKKTIYVPGVGVDTAEYQLTDFNRELKRKSLGIEGCDIVILSVGELNHNKNHELVLRVLSKLNLKNITYVICGEGNLKEVLIQKARQLNVNLMCLGYRNDIREILKMSDFFLFPSKREGLSVALMEAMASGLPIICSKIRGNVDLVSEGINGFLCNKEADYAEAIKLLIYDKILYKKISDNNILHIKQFDIQTVTKLMLELYSDFNILVSEHSKK